MAILLLLFFRLSWPAWLEPRKGFVRDAPQLTLCEFGHQLSITRAQRGANLVALSHAAVLGPDDLAGLNEGATFVWVISPSKRVETVLFPHVFGAIRLPPERTSQEIPHATTVGDPVGVADLNIVSKVGPVHCVVYLIVVIVVLPEICKVQLFVIIFFVIVVPLAPRF